MHSIQVELGPASYHVHVGPGARARLAALLAERTRAGRVAVVTDETVAALHLPTLRAALPAAPTTLVVPPGEQSKSLWVARELYDALAAARIEREDALIALGGGVVGDLAGFVAATWLRGIPFVQAPTTLEAAVDAAVGGKTGLNHPAGKNLIGAFHQPVGVVIDTDFLETLPRRDFIAGLAESVKHALIRDAAFFEWHERNAGALAARQADTVAALIARNCEIKAEVVRQDERERGLRAVLNFGHTVGHALEHLLGYELRHGECVSLGIIAANTLAVARGLLDGALAARGAALLAELGLPTRLPRAVDAAEVVNVCRSDKKVRGGAINFILLTGLGATVRVADVSDAEIAAAVAALQP